MIRPASGPCMTRRHSPPGRTSIFSIVVVKPKGPHQLTSCPGLSSVEDESRRGIESTVSTSSRSAAGLRTSLPLLLFRDLHFAYECVETVEALLPKHAVVADPTAASFSG